MGHRATQNCTPPLVRRSVWADWKRTVGVIWPLVLVLLTGYGLLIVREGRTGLTVSSGAGRATLPWRSVQQAWRYPDFWLLLLSPSQCITLPLYDLPEPMRTEILARLQQHGGQVG